MIVEDTGGAISGAPPGAFPADDMGGRGAIAGTRGRRHSRRDSCRRGKRRCDQRPLRARQRRSSSARLLLRSSVLAPAP